MTEWIGGLMIVLGMALMLIAPIHTTLLHRPRIRAAMIAPALRAAFPITPPAPPLDELVRKADESLAQDPLIRATADLARTYDQA